MSFSAVELIIVKRDGGELSSEAIAWLIDEYTKGSVPDYQMSALAMAILLNGMSPEELTAWTAAMLNSGDRMDFSDLAAAKVDKHSTGGVGDKVSLPLAPLVASCGVVVPMISGRGLAHTGGTLDKLESVSGFTTALDPETFQSILRHHGLVMAGQSETMAPADQKLYALRDATGTVPSIPLIASSILSKKLAEGLDGLVLDVKTGSGASMRQLEDSRELARTMVEIASGYGVKTTALVTSMEQPLGREVGNASEIRESIDVLRGEGPPDVTELTMVLAEEMLELAGLPGGRILLEEKIASGAAFDKLVEVTAAHGGDTAMLRDPSRLPVAAYEGVVVAESDGYVQMCDALTVGIAATHLGAGREKKEDTVHPGVGITVTAKIGDQVKAGEPLAMVRYDQESKWLAYRDLLATAWTIGPDEIPAPPLIIERIHGALT